MKTKRALSKVLSSQRHRGLLVLFPPDSWDHPSPTEQNLLPGQVIPEEAAGVGCPHHPSHPSLWFCNPAEGGRRGNPAWLSGISLQPRVPGLQTPNHGQSWRPNRPEEFRTSSRNREPSTQPLLCSSPSLLQPGHLSMGPGEILDSQTQHKKRGFKRTWRFLLLHRPQRGH